MIKLNTKGFTWLDLGEGQKVKCKTPNLISLKAAQRHDDVRSEGVNSEGKPTPEAAILIGRHLIIDALIGWEGICGEDGATAPFNEITKLAFANDLDANLRFTQLYAEYLNAVDAEKNA